MTLDAAKEKLNTDEKFSMFVQIYCMFHIVEKKEAIYLDELLPDLADFYDAEFGKNIT